MPVPHFLSRTALAAALALTALTFAGVDGSSNAHAQSVDCEALAKQLKRRRDDRTLNAFDYRRLRSKGC